MKLTLFTTFSLCCCNTHQLWQLMYCDWSRYQRRPPGSVFSLLDLQTTSDFRFYFCGIEINDANCDSEFDVFFLLCEMWAKEITCLQMVFSSKTTGTSCFSAGCDVSSPSICICVVTVWWFPAAQWQRLRLCWFFHPSTLTSAPRHDWSTGELRRKHYECQYWPIS